MFVDAKFLLRRKIRRKRRTKDGARVLRRTRFPFLCPLLVFLGIFKCVVPFGPSRSRVLSHTSSFLLVSQEYQARNAQSRTIVGQRIRERIDRGRSSLQATERALSEVEIAQQGSLTLGVPSTVLVPATMIESEIQNLLDIVQDFNRLQIATLTGQGVLGDGGIEWEDFDYDGNLHDE